MRDQTETNAAGSGAAAGRGPALVIVAEAPRPGNVLTGLCPPLRHGEAAALQTAWLKGIAQPLPGVAVWLFGRPADALPMLRYFAGPGVELREWTPPAGDPSSVFRAAATDLLAAGHAPVLVRGADAPDVEPRQLLACLAAAFRGDTVIARDQRGEPWAIALPSNTPTSGGTGSAPVRRGPWARTVQHPDDLDLLWRERLGLAAAGSPTLPVRNLQASLHFYETAFGAELRARGEDSAALTVHGAELRLVQRDGVSAKRGDLAKNGLCLPCEDLDAAALRVADCGGVAPPDAPQDRVGGGRDFTATDPDGHRLTFCTPLAQPGAPGPNAP
jgi:predicted enzyme related to lactoylglutathione lyase